MALLLAEMVAAVQLFPADFLAGVRRKGAVYDII